ncbi:MAG TPA: o-succinylbenzoate synthase [Actinomycetota bacterium]|nr:o-succinylbenzoate synthase [Actinomycetota bacterium]
MRCFRIPLRVRFRGVEERSGVLLRGPHGWGEFSPFPEYGATESARWLRAALEAAADGWPAAVRDAVPVNAIVPAVAPATAHEMTRASGCTTVKVKVADGDDEARVEAVRDALGPEGRIRIDVNAAWDVDEAARRINALARYGLEYVEQPVATLDEMAALRRLVDVPVAADESVRKAEDPLHIAGLDAAADLVVLKVQPLGGVRRALRVAEAVGLPAVVSSAVETSVGLAAGLALAAALPELPYACGLGTQTLLAGDVTRDPLVPVDGMLAVRRPDVDEDALAPFEVTGRPDGDALLERLHAAEAAL